MAVLLNEKEFEELILKKGKDFGDLLAAEVELEAYKKAGHLEYLYYVYSFCNTLKEHNILYSVRNDDYPSYIMEILGVDNIPHFRTNIQSYKYNRGRKNQFTIYIPMDKKDDVIDLFTQLTSCYVHKDDYLTLFFGEDEKYQITLIQHVYLGKLSKINIEAIKDIHKNDEAVINYMIQVDDKGYYMPNLYASVYGDIDLWYSLINVAKPKNIEDLEKIYSLMISIFADRKLLINHIKEYGLGDIICTREQLYKVLCDGYDIPIERVDSIRINLNRMHRLCESDELILESNEVPIHIINQLKNIRYLSFAVHSVIGIELIYMLSYIKFYYRDDFIKSIPPHKYQAYVGPFFYINNKVYAHKESIKDFDYDLRFFDSKTSHFFYFHSIDIDGDYGNYPRGRVIYDNYNHRFIIYLDTSLMNKDTKEKIKDAYFLNNEKVLFRRDEHYTHDGL